MTRKSDAPTGGARPRIEYTWEGESWSWHCCFGDPPRDYYGLFTSPPGSPFVAARRQAIGRLAEAGGPGTVRAYEHVLVDPEIDRMVEECRYVKAQAAFAAEEYLRARKRTVVALVRRGLPLREIARMMGVSVQRAAIWVSSQKNINAR